MSFLGIELPPDLFGYLNTAIVVGLIISVLAEWSPWFQGLSSVSKEKVMTIISAVVTVVLTLVAATIPEGTLQEWLNAANPFYQAIIPLLELVIGLFGAHLVATQVGHRIGLGRKHS